VPIIFPLIPKIASLCEVVFMRLPSRVKLIPKYANNAVAKMAAAGLSDQEAEQYEEELDKGKLVIIANKDVK